MAGVDRSKQGRASRQKGARGELQIVKVLRLIAERRYGAGADCLTDSHHLWFPKRNLEQTAHGGCDILWGDYAIEVKNDKSMRIAKWWSQAVNQALASKSTPILAYKDRRAWFFKMRHPLLEPHVNAIPVFDEEDFKAIMHHLLGLPCYTAVK